MATTTEPTLSDFNSMTPVESALFTMLAGVTFEQRSNRARIEEELRALVARATRSLKRLEDPEWTPDSLEACTPALEALVAKAETLRNQASVLTALAIKMDETSGTTNAATVGHFGARSGEVKIDRISNLDRLTVACTAFRSFADMKRSIDQDGYVPSIFPLVGSSREKEAKLALVEVLRAENLPVFTG